MLKSARIAFLLAAVLAMAGCQKNFTAYALTSTGSILKFDTSKPGTISSTVTISGLNSGQSVVQFDYQPSTGTLFCITNDGFVCTVDPGTGTATVVANSGTPFTQTLGSGNNTVRLSNPAISFDPVSGDLRVLSTEYNLLVNPGTGLIDTTGTKVAFDNNDSNHNKTPQLGGIAYTNPLAGATNTTLYALDVTTASLLRVGDDNVGNAGSVNSGDLHTIGPLNASLSSTTGFAISPNNGTAYASLQNGNGAALYTVDLKSGAVTGLGSIGDGTKTVTSLVISR